MNNFVDNAKNYWQNSSPSRKRNIVIWGSIIGFFVALKIYAVTDPVARCNVARSYADSASEKLSHARSYARENGAVLTVKGAYDDQQQASENAIAECSK